MVSQVLSTSGVGGLEYRSTAALCTDFQAVLVMTAMGCHDTRPVVMNFFVFVQRARSLCHVDVDGVSSFHVYSWDDVPRRVCTRISISTDGVLSCSSGIWLHAKVHSISIHSDAVRGSTWVVFASIDGVVLSRC